MANDHGVKIYDLDRESRSLELIDQKQTLKNMRVWLIAVSKLFWENDRTLLIGWGDCWMIVRIQEGTRFPLPRIIKGLITEWNWWLGMAAVLAEQLQLSGRITAVFHVPALICGIASFGDDICLLTYSIDSEDTSDSSDGGSDSGEDVILGTMVMKMLV